LERSSVASWECRRGHTARRFKPGELSLEFPGCILWTKRTNTAAHSECVRTVRPTIFNEPNHEYPKFHPPRRACGRADRARAAGDV
jgi:hypothetical protein